MLTTCTSRTLLFSPFVPFIVLFCHIIEARDQTDLDRLGTFVASIQPASDISDAAAKLHRLFQVLHSVALRYVELHSSTPDDGQAEASGEIDRYLAALGIPSSTGQGLQRGFVQSMGSDFAQGELDMAGANPADGQSLINPMMRMGNGAELEHWLYNNQAMWALMEKPDFLPPRQS